MDILLWLFGLLIVSQLIGGMIRMVSRASSSPPPPTPGPSRSRQGGSFAELARALEEAQRQAQQRQGEPGGRGEVPRSDSPFGEQVAPEIVQETVRAKRPKPERTSLEETRVPPYDEESTVTRPSSARQHPAWRGEERPVGNRFEWREAVIEAEILGPPRAKNPLRPRR
ncbi:hypothetical protein HNR42_001810 [Deinobacterium chartae]|uniref:Uncharacterized protein n=1 Tax=Deinobacterium chartae TaxID=521158 RepID=A0A841HZT4_9DEIO|nr:hypothetical protein [Deinobacterium chartae]